MDCLIEFLKIIPTFRNGDGNGYGYGYGYVSGSGYGDGSGSGYGYVSGSGYGYGYGYGDGNGDGYGNGDGNGYGDGYGNGDGYGDGNGDGYGNGDGNGYGDGYGLKSFDNQKVYYIDTIPTIINTIKNNIALGYIINSDFTLSSTYIVKNDNYFAHGKTLKEAYNSLNEKIFQNLDKDEIISKFKVVFENFNMNYPNSEFFKWHNYLTGSCKFGRESFAKNHGIDIENGQMTVLEFIELTKDSYNGNVIKNLSNEYKHNK